LILVVVTTTLIYISTILGKFIDRLAKRKSYTSGDYVPETNYYICKVCKNKKKYIKNAKFSICKKHKSILKKIKSVFIFYNWKKDEHLNRKTKSIKIHT